MEEQILLYYLKVFSLSLFIVFLLTLIYSFYLFSKNNLYKNDIINIKKGESFERIIKNNIKNLNRFDIEIFKLYYKFNYRLLKNKVHYGDFFIDTIFEIATAYAEPDPNKSVEKNEKTNLFESMYM